MKPLFTIHGGEYLFGNELEARFPELRIWIPSKDDGIDFLLTNREHQKPLTIQIKYSRDFNWSHGNIILKPHTKSAAWYSLNREKIENSKADYWVLVNYDGFKRSADYIFIKPTELLAKFDALNRKAKRIECYVMVTENMKCYETRNLRKPDYPLLLSGALDKTQRNLTHHLERWDIIEKHFR